MRRPVAPVLALLASCGGPQRPPPPPLSFNGLPVSGSMAGALDAGFTSCITFTTEMRCRRHDVMLLGEGPYEAAVDLVGGDDGGGFDQLTLWHDRDQMAVAAIGDALEGQSWRSCYTGEGMKGDQAIYTHPEAQVRVSMDLSYWGKRRLRVIPEWNSQKPRC